MHPFFNVRVYGLWVNSKQEILLSDEQIVTPADGIKPARTFTFTKFPGGGLQYGEGTIECLKREWLEETGITPNRIAHFHTTDYFQPSAFAKAGIDEQVIAIYYRVWCSEAELNLRPPASEERVRNLRFESIRNLEPDALTFDVDRIAAAKLKQLLLYKI